MNGTGSNESVNPWSLGMFNSIPSSSNVILIASGESTDNGNIAIVIDIVSNLIGNHFNSFQVFSRCGGKSGFDDVYPKFGKLASNVEFLLRSHGGAGGLFTVAESSVEDADIGGIRDVIGDVRRTVARGMGMGLGGT